MNHFADPDFWFHYRHLPTDIRALADKCFSLLKTNPRPRSLRLKKVVVLNSATVSLHYHPLTKKHPDGLQWFWIGHHSTYDRLPNAH